MKKEKNKPMKEKNEGKMNERKREEWNKERKKKGMMGESSYKNEPM